MTPSAAGQVLRQLADQQQTLATAESLTGGLIGELITDVAGASAVYAGGVITYATRLKATLAGVEESTLTRDGPVAPTTAAEMATGVAAKCATDWGLAATGVAGPGAQDGHRVGQVFVAVSHPGSSRTWVREFHLSGTRADIRCEAAERALGLLAEALGMNVAAPLVE